MQWLDSIEPGHSISVQRTSIDTVSGPARSIERGAIVVERSRSGSVFFVRLTTLAEPQAARSSIRAVQ